jgi:hypothetical protein
MNNFNDRDISTIAISLAKIMKQLESRGQRAATGSLQHILHDLLIGGDNSENKHYIFSEISTHAIIILSKFDARYLWNLINLYGHAEYIPTVENDRTLQHFNSQGLSTCSGCTQK